MGRPLPFVELSGGPRDWGLQHGKGARRAVDHNVLAYLRRFTEWAGIPRDELRRRAEAYRGVIEAANPDYAAAMAGIAEGAGQDLLDVVALNVRYEIMYSEFANRGLERAASLAAAGGCTSFAVLPELSANGHLIIGQNWDWIPESQGLVVRAKGEDGSVQLGFTEAGIAGAKMGLNDAGLGLVINGLVSDQDGWSRLKTPFHVRCWEVLRSKHLPDAERAVTREGRSCSSNFLLAQTGADGARVVDLETAPEGACRLEPAGGYLSHTNHFLDEQKLGIRQPLAEDRPSTFTRYGYVQGRLQAWAAAGKKVRINDLKGILRDHTNAPSSLCRHSIESLAPDDRYETVVSVLIDLDAREMHVASGTPCTAKYRRFALT